MRRTGYRRSRWGLLLASRLHIQFFERGLERPDAAETPLGGHHLFDVQELDIVGRLEAVEEGLEEFLECGRVLVGEDYCFGGEAMFDRVLSNAEFALGRDRSAGVCAVGAGSFDLVRSSHDDLRHQRSVATGGFFERILEVIGIKGEINAENA